MPDNNLYWSVYKNLEKEFIRLADFIHFSDDQIGVYSMYIADLIIRCSIEIEAISKELYCILGGDMNPVDRNGNKRDLYFDTDCLDLLEKKWVLSKKQINVSAINFYFDEDKNRIITPLHKSNKRGTSGSIWKQAYQALKHDRKKSITKSTIKNLLHALGALYILNLYYRDEKIEIDPSFAKGNNFNIRAGSEIFSAHFCRATSLKFGPIISDKNIDSLSDEELLKSIYIIKYDEESLNRMYKNYCLDEEITTKQFKESNEIKIFLSAHPEYMQKNINEICLAAGGLELLKRIVSSKYIMKNKVTKYEAILNKHSLIYQIITPEMVSELL